MKIIFKTFFRKILSFRNTCYKSLATPMCISCYNKLYKELCLNCKQLLVMSQQAIEIINLWLCVNGFLVNQMIRRNLNNQGVW